MHRLPRRAGAGAGCKGGQLTACPAARCCSGSRMRRRKGTGESQPHSRVSCAAMQCHAVASHRHACGNPWCPYGPLLLATRCEMANHNLPNYRLLPNPNVHPAFIATCRASGEPLVPPAETKAELVLRTCGAALYPALDWGSRRMLRYVCKTARAAIDPHVKVLVLYTATYPAPYADVGTRWPNARRLVCDTRRFNLLSRLPPRLQELELVDHMILPPQWPFRLLLGSVATSLQHLKFVYYLVDSDRTPQPGACLYSVLPALHGLRRLSLDCYSSYGDTWLHHMEPALGQLASLTELRLMSVRDPLYDHQGPGEPCGRALSCLASLTRLEVLVLDTPMLAEGVRAVASALGRLTALRELGIVRAQLSSDSFASLAPALANLPTLERLSLGHNALSSAIAHLPRMPQLHVLDISGNSLQGEGRHVASALLRVPALTELILDDDATSDDLQHIAGALPRLPWLQALHWSACGGSGVLPGVLAPHLGSLTALKRLKLAWGSPGEQHNDGVPELCTALARLTGLEELIVKGHIVPLPVQPEQLRQLADRGSPG